MSTGKNWQQELEQLFGPDGALSRSLTGYEPRQEQVDVACAIEQSMREGKICLAEAGTGVGKSLAYLIPAVRAALAGKVTVVSTYTLGLQEQLVRKDIPLAMQVVPYAKNRVKVSLLKGRANYLCLLALHNAKNDLFLSTDPALKQIERWSMQDSCSGDVADLPIAYSSWSDLASTQDSCPAADCPYYNRCFYYQARNLAQESQLVVVNHALFLSDLAIRRNEPNAGFLPAYEHVVMDEAHQLEETASRTFGLEFGSTRIPALVERLRRMDIDLDEERLNALELMNSQLFGNFAQVNRQEFLMQDVLTAEEQVNNTSVVTLICTSLAELANELLDFAKTEEGRKEILEGFARSCVRAREELPLLFGEAKEGMVRWGERGQANRRNPELRVVLHATPVSVADILTQGLWEREKTAGRNNSVSLISATLANSGGFEYLQNRLGISGETVERIVGSPFPFREHALLYVPAHLPEPPKTMQTHYIDEMSAEIVRLLNLTEGRAFLLFTARNTMNAVHEILQTSVPYPLFKQGDMPPAKLLDEFRRSGNGCLMGLQTFWEGVDVRGEALSLVVIDRLPFAVPDSPVTQARTRAITEAGGDWFQEFSLPQAQIRLKQGFGRLIRTQDDLGIVCILDTRMLTKRYGNEFVTYLPPATRASKWSRVEKFWRKHQQSQVQSAQAESEPETEPEV